MGERTVRLERDGDVAHMILANPPLNLFGDKSFDEIAACIAEVDGSDARALVWRAEGEIFSGGVDVNGFQRVVDAGPERAAEFAAPLIDTVHSLEAPWRSCTGSASRRGSRWRWAAT